MIYKKQLIAVFALFAIFSSQIFFVSSNLLGYEYTGKEDSSAYVIFIASIASINFILYIASLYRSPKFAIAEVGVYFFIIYSFINHLIWVYYDEQSNPVFPNNLVLFLAIGLNGFIAARVVSVNKAWVDLIRISGFFCWLMSMAFVFSVFLPYLGGDYITGIGGASYQIAGYYAAITFGLLMVLSFRLESTYKYKIFWHKSIHSLNIFLLVSLAVVVLINAARGAFVLIVIYMLLGLYWYISAGTSDVKKITRILLSGAFIVVLISYAFQQFSEDSVLSDGLSRATEFIFKYNEISLNLSEGSSGRDAVYAEALDGIYRSPWIGYGAFAHWEKVVEPHNIILDVFLQFGVPVGVFVILISSFFVLKCMYSIRNCKNELSWFLVLLIYPMVHLSVSDGYLRSSVFWFCIGGVLFFSKSRVR